MVKPGVEIKPGAKYERHRRQIKNKDEPADKVDVLFSDGCKQNDFKAAVELEIEELLLKNEEIKLQYVNDAYAKYLLRNRELELSKKPSAEEVEKGAKKLTQLQKTLTETKEKLIAQLEEQRINGIALVNEKSKLLNEIRDNNARDIANSDLEKKKLLEQIKANNEKITRMKDEYKQIKSQKDSALMIEATKNAHADTCESQFAYLGPFDSPNILRVKKQQLETDESTLTDIWQKKNNLKNCCQQGGCQ